MCHPAVRTPGASLRVLPVVEDALETKTISQAAVEERLLVCCCEALSTCTDVQTEQVSSVSQRRLRFLFVSASLARRRCVGSASMNEAVLS